MARANEKPLSGFSLAIPVRFAECDPYGVVWHGHYALYLEQAREALTSRFGFTATKALEMGYRVPITRMEIRYRLPILADRVTVVEDRAFRVPTVPIPRRRSLANRFRGLRFRPMGTVGLEPTTR